MHCTRCLQHATQFPSWFLPRKSSMLWRLTCFDSLRMQSQYPVWATGDSGPTTDCCPTISCAYALPAGSPMELCADPFTLPAWGNDCAIFKLKAGQVLRAHLFSGQWQPLCARFHQVTTGGGGSALEEKREWGGNKSVNHSEMVRFCGMAVTNLARPVHG